MIEETLTVIEKAINKKITTNLYLFPRKQTERALSMTLVVSVFYCKLVNALSKYSNSKKQELLQILYIEAEKLIVRC